MEIRPLSDGDVPQLHALAEVIVQDGTTYVYEDAGDFVSSFLRGHAYVAVEGDELLGAYYFRANQPGRGAHVANASYAVTERARNQGVGRALGEHSIEAARAHGFRALQFNLVVATNEAAIALWQKLGFTIAGTLPQAFRHQSQRYVDAHVMYRLLD